MKPVGSLFSAKAGVAEALQQSESFMERLHAVHGENVFFFFVFLGGPMTLVGKGESFFFWLVGGFRVVSDRFVRVCSRVVSHAPGVSLMLFGWF